VQIAKDTAAPLNILLLLIIITTTTTLLALITDKHGMLTNHFPAVSQ